MSVLDVRGRGALAPASALPLAYFAFAHLSLAAGLAVLAASPDLPGAFFYHPKMIAVVHLLTLGWITGSILGAFHVIAPLGLVMAMPTGWRDWAGFASFVIGTAGMIAHFWIGTYDGMTWSAGLVMLTIAHLAWRAARGLRQAPLPGAIVLHIALAFFNIAVAGALGILIGLDRTRGFLGLPPVAATLAHAHVAAIGWAMMMAIGLSYRLMPMMLPAVMPKGRALYASALLIETGLALLVAALFTGWAIVPLAAACLIAGLAAFVRQMMRTALRRLPRPPALPMRDWSIWQVHAAFLWLLIAAVLGWILGRDGAGARPALAWVYGTAGLLGFLAQLITGMYGRLAPFYAWYRAMGASGERPRGSAHTLPSPRLARATFFTWSGGVPMLAAGLAGGQGLLIRAGALVLLAGVACGAIHLGWMLRGARRFVQASGDDSGGRRSIAPRAHHAH